MVIEKRITAALSNRDIKSDALAELIVETESAIAAAEQAAEAERTKALDPLQSPDADAAHAAMQSAEFAVQRLRTILPRLQKRYQQVADAEEYGAWATTFDRLKPKHSAAAAKLKTIYIEFEAKVVEALTEARQVDAEVQVVMHRKPYHLWESNNDGRGLPTVEAAARGLTGVSSDYSLMSMKIPVFNSANQLAWPPPQIPLAVQVARSMVPVPGDPRQFTNRWHEVAAEKAQAARQQRLREQQEAQAKIDADPRADQWWKVRSA